MIQVEAFARVGVISCGCARLDAWKDGHNAEYEMRAFIFYNQVIRAIKSCPHHAWCLTVASLYPHCGHDCPEYVPVAVGIFVRSL